MRSEERKTERKRNWYWAVGIIAVACVLVTGALIADRSTERKRKGKPVITTMKLEETQSGASAERAFWESSGSRFAELEKRMAHLEKAASTAQREKEEAESKLAELQGDIERREEALTATFDEVSDIYVSRIEDLEQQLAAMTPQSGPLLHQSAVTAPPVDPFGPAKGPQRVNKRQGQSEDSDPDIGIGGVEQVSFELTGPKKETAARIYSTEEYVPAGAYAEAVVLAGVDASAGVSAGADPRPVTFRILGPAISVLDGTDRQSTDIVGCVVIGEGRGDLSSEKVYVRLLRMSCAGEEQGTVREVAVRGYAAGSGSAGVRGPLVSREGALVAGAFGAGVIGGIGETTSNALTGLGSGITINTEEGSDRPSLGSAAQDVATGSLGRGFSRAGKTLENYLIERAEQVQPVVVMQSGRHVELVFTEGFFLDGRSKEAAHERN